MMGANMFSMLGAAAVALLSSVVVVQGFVGLTAISNPATTCMKAAEGFSADGCISRKGFFSQVAGALVLGSSLGLVPLQPPAALAAETVPGGDRLLTGVKQLEYLLANWDQETTVCNAAKECERRPDNVRRYLGLRSTTDPLFNIERVLDKAQAYIDDPDDLETFVDASELFQSTKSMANSMAYTSSFGEYNPGGGKDQVEKYLEESRKQVIVAKDSLSKIADILKLR